MLGSIPPETVLSFPLTAMVRKRDHVKADPLRPSSYPGPSNDDCCAVVPQVACWPLHLPTTSLTGFLLLLLRFREVEETREKDFQARGEYIASKASVGWLLG